jgi:GT2 family glycosyltransferase
MTYKRSEIALNTIKSLLNQTLPPEKILIIDNDPECSARHIADNFEDVDIDYYSMGYNSGPAGAANKGLKLLADKGYQWIAWIDDDDPPTFNDTFEILIDILRNHPECGCTGAVGQYFNDKLGLISRVKDNDLLGGGLLSVDNIAGGMCKIVNANVVRNFNILPNPDLFYGFEELDFDLNLKKHGFQLLVDKSLYFKHRKFYNRLDFNNKSFKKKDYKRIQRDYYSTRNLIYIVIKYKLFLAVFFIFLRLFFKSLIGFKFGFNYGYQQSKYISYAIYDAITNKMGTRKLN